MTLTYKELQAKLKDLRANGYDVQVKLNSKLEVLQAEFDRLTCELEQEVVLSSDSFVLPTSEMVLTQTTAIATDTEVVSDDELQYCNFFPQQLVYDVTDFDKTGNTKRVLFGGQVVFYLCHQDWFVWELQQWLTKHEGLSCDVMFETTLNVREFGERETYTAVESQPLTVEFLANETKGVTKTVLENSQVYTSGGLQGVTRLLTEETLSELTRRVADDSKSLPLYVLLLAWLVWGLACLGRTVVERLSTFARETAWQAWQNLVWMLRCCWFFSLGFFKL